MRRFLCSLPTALMTINAAVAADPPLITHTTNRNDYTVHYEVTIIPPKNQRLTARCDPGYDEAKFVLNEVDFYFPIIENTAASTTDPEAVQAQFFWQGQVWTDQYVIMPVAPGFGRYGHVEFSGDPASRRNVSTALGNPDASNKARLIFRVPTVCRESVFDERRAMEIPWPATMPPPLLAWTKPEPGYIESDDQTVIELMNDWTDSRPRELNPALLAKTIAAGVVEYVQPDGARVGGSSRARLQGLDVQGAAFVAENERGTIYDMVCLYVAACRAAGLPTRAVIGLDVDQTNKHGFPTFHAWAEFALVDSDNNRIEWIPVDIVRQREFSSRPPPLPQTWEYFGNNRFLDTTVPVAFHFLPPSGAVGGASVLPAVAPALWGWALDPAIESIDTELNIMIMGTPQSPR